MLWKRSPFLSSLYVRIFISYVILELYFYGSTVAFATDIPWTHFGTRPLAMGNAFVSVVDDYNALFYNPAGLRLIEGIKGELLHPTIDISKKTLKTINDLRKKKSTGSSDDALTLYDRMAGYPHYASLKLTPYLVTPIIGAGLGFDTRFQLMAHEGILVDTWVGAIGIAPLAGAFSLLSHQLHIGFAVKWIYTAYYDKGLNLDTLAGTSSITTPGAFSHSVKQGQGIGYDLGVLVAPDYFLKPRLGISLTDVGGTSFKISSGSRQPDPRAPSLNAGISSNLYSGGAHSLRLAFDVHQINQTLHTSKKFSLGLEFSLGGSTKLQGGLREGLYSAGFQLDFKLLKLRFATYGADQSVVAGTNSNNIDRRYVVDLNLLI